MPGVFQFFDVVALSFACVLHIVMSSCALHHHVFKLASVPASPFLPLSVLSPDTLARARGTSKYYFISGQKMFSEWVESWRAVLF